MTIERTTLLSELLPVPWAEEVLAWHGVDRDLYPGVPLESLRWTAGIDVDRLLVDLIAAARTFAMESDRFDFDPWTAELEPPVTVPPAPTRVQAG